MANSDFGVCRNGPPEAVSQMRSTSCMRPPRRHWCTALCSLSMGSSGLPWRRASAVISSPATTRHSLLARPTDLARFHGFVGGLQPGDADNGADHEIDIRMSGDADGSRSSVNHFNPGEAGMLDCLASSASAVCSVATETIAGRQRSACS